MSPSGYRPVAELHLDAPRAAEIFRRHDLFRRRVCSRLARDIAPDDDGVIDVVCRAMFYHNARSFFGWKT